eukprot:CAMPEP_0116122034 /NCGR_PEP_ID=MMETSP0329-20121206/4004_1 /TAXON_ID=697910 /ORGANISM="Pseudo-nitzschia arenysensis, Strain B593" /LENGTH=761 /DNA_ID=CAMNT_0003615865 /DNA_START=518 /DNA_END=2803 /DNA_ORIENTATION=+
MTITKLDLSAIVGLQNFGKSLKENADIKYSNLTILPGSFKNLCRLQTAEDYNYESMEFPQGDIAVMVDMEEGGCDMLTKASNAILLQEYMTKHLKYIIFYSGKQYSVSLPELNLDSTIPPTAMPSYEPTTSNPTEWPTYLTYEPTTSGPTYLTYEPTTSVSMSTTDGSTDEPTLTTQPSDSEWPSSGKPSTSMGPSMGPSVGPSMGSTLKIPSTDSPTTERPIIQLPTTEDTINQEPTSQIPTISSLEPSTSKPSEISETEEDAFIIRRLQNSRNLPLSYEINMDASTLFREREKQEREREKQELEENNSMIFLSISMDDAHTILAGIYRAENWADGKTPEFSKEGNKNWDMLMYLRPTKGSGGSPSCNTVPIPDIGKYPTPSFVVTPKPSPTPSSYVSNNGRQPSKSYQDNAPGSFAIFKFVLFGLLIASPCLRLIHQWWASGGRIRLRRSQDGDSNRIVGLQYIPPMDNWIGGPQENIEAPRPPDRLTLQQIMSLPEIQYTKPIHNDDKLSNTQTMEETDDSLENSSNHLYNESEDNDDNNQGECNNTEIIGTPAESVVSTGREQIDRDESIASEASFENEPSVRLELPTSPPRVSSASVSQTSNPLSPRAIVQTEEVPPDEERPEEQQEHPEEQPTLSPTPISPPVSPLPSLLQEQPQQCLRVEEIPPLSFRTQRRLQSFTTTTCTTCSICIDEFEEGETIRLLPRCGHAFHTDCILPWLQDRQGCCPLCKTDVLDRGSQENSDDNNDESRNERRSSF